MLTLSIRQVTKGELHRQQPLHDTDRQPGGLAAGEAPKTGAERLLGARGSADGAADAQPAVQSKPAPKAQSEVQKTSAPHPTAPPRADKRATMESHPSHQLEESQRRGALPWRSRRGKDRSATARMGFYVSAKRTTAHTDVHCVQHSVKSSRHIPLKCVTR